MIINLIMRNKIIINSLFDKYMKNLKIVLCKPIEKTETLLE